MANIDLPTIGDIVMSPHSKVFTPQGTEKYDLLDLSSGGAVDGGVYPVLAGKLGYSGAGVDKAVYDSVSFSVEGQEVNPYGFVFSSDGTKMYIMGSSTRRVHQYTLATAWDLSTASYDNVSFSMGDEQGGIPYGIAFSSEGTKVYMLEYSTKRVYQYTLTTAWDLGTASYGSVSFFVGGQDSNPYGISFNSEGTKMYIAGGGSKRVYQYSLTTAWVLSTASYDSVSFSVSGQDTTSYGLTFSSDGTKMYIMGSSTRRVHQYTLATAWDLSTASYGSVSFSVRGQEVSPYGIAFSSDGTKMYMLGFGTKKVHQYTIPAGGYFLPTLPPLDPRVPYKIVGDLT